MNWIKIAKFLGPVLAAAVILFWTYTAGSNHGAKVVQTKWDAAELARTKAISKEQGAIAFKQSQHAAEDREISDALDEANATHARNVAAITADFTKRLHDSENRAGVYQRLAKGTASEQERLASHAAELDRSLEEGRQLVEEFRSAIDQRDGQLKLLGAQIINDRKLFSSDTQNDSTTSDPVGEAH